MSARIQPNLDENTVACSLLLACIRSYFEPSLGSGRQGLSQQTLDWQKTLALARLHGVTPLLYAGSRRSSEAIPQAALASIRSEFQHSAASSFRYTDELIRLSALFQRVGIQFLAFKGPTLGADLYGSLALRTFRDLDLLVSPDQLRRTIDVLLSCGYDYDNASDREADLLSSKTDKHVLLINRVCSSQVEIHWAVATPVFYFRIAFADLWRRRRHVTVRDTAIATVSVEDLVLLLCVHGTSHAWRSFKWICDVAAFVQKYPDIDWEAVDRRSKKLGCERMLLTGLVLARDLIGIALPPIIEEQVRQKQVVEQMSNDLRSTLWGRQLYTRKMLFVIRSRERLWDRIKLTANFVKSNFSPTYRDTEFIRLPRPFYFLYPPLRVFRVTFVQRRRAVLRICQGLLGH